MNILIADDHILFRDTLYQYICRAQPLYQVKTASSFHDVLEMLKAPDYEPDLCIIDFKMPGMKGCQSFIELMQLYPNYTFAVMSGVAEPSQVKKILDVGVVGFLPKTLPGRLMLKAIDTMLEGKKYIPYDTNGINLMPTYFTGMTAIEPEPPQEIMDNTIVFLTPRERDVLHLLSEGKSNREIAGDLQLQTVTVKLHLRGIYRKLGCNNRTKAVLKARAMGLAS